MTTPPVVWIGPVWPDLGRGRLGQVSQLLGNEHLCDRPRAIRIVAGHESVRHAVGVLCLQAGRQLLRLTTVHVHETTPLSKDRQASRRGCCRWPRAQTQRAQTAACASAEGLGRVAAFLERVEDEGEAVLERGREVVADVGDVPGYDFREVGKLLRERG